MAVDPNFARIYERQLQEATRARRALASIAAGAIGSMPERHAPMVALTRPAPAGTTWVDCVARGGKHRLHLRPRTTAAAWYWQCQRCPSVIRISRNDLSREGDQ